MKRTRRLSLSVVLFAVVSVAASSQVRSTALDQPSEIYRPRDYVAGELYPLVVFLPYTGGSSRDQARAFGANPGSQRGYMVMLPPGRFRRDDYLPDFIRFVGWVEERVVADIRAAIDQFNVDPQRIYLAGYSLGGDLSWALAARNPGLVSGMVMAGTRASYPISDENLAVMGSRGFRTAMLIGSQESPERYQGINRARATVERAAIDLFYREYAGGHSIPPRALLQEALAFVLQAAPSQIAQPSVPRAAPPSQGGAQNTVASAPGGGSSSGLIDLLFLDQPPAGFATVRYVPPVAAGSGGITVAGIHELSVDYRVIFGSLRLSGATGYRSEESTGGVRLARIPQSITVGWGASGWAIGLDWSWHSFFVETPELTAVRRFALHGTLSHRAHTLPLAGLLTARVRAPLSLQVLRLPDIMNLELAYALDIDELVRIDLGLASFAQQNAPVSTIGDLSNALDYVARWSAGLAVRLPTRFRWGLRYTGEFREPLGLSATATTEHLVQLQLAYLF